MNVQVSQLNRRESICHQGSGQLDTILPCSKIHKIFYRICFSTADGCQHVSFPLVQGRRLAGLQVLHIRVLPALNRCYIKLRTVKSGNGRNVILVTAGRKVRVLRTKYSLSSNLLHFSFSMILMHVLQVYALFHYATTFTFKASFISLTEQTVLYICAYVCEIERERSNQ